MAVDPTGTGGEITAGAIRVEFIRHADRIAHIVSIRQEDRWLPVLQSVESNAETDWPDSPPLQSVHLEDRPEGKVALLVGMAGSSHWSAAVTANEAAQQITLDIACRVRDIATAEWLGSRYRSLVGAKWNELIAVEARSNSGLLPEENGVTLQPTNFKEILQVPGKAATICWCYVLRASAES